MPCWSVLFEVGTTLPSQCMCITHCYKNAFFSRKSKFLIEIPDSCLVVLPITAKTLKTFSEALLTYPYAPRYGGVYKKYIAKYGGFKKKHKNLCDANINNIMSSETFWLMLINCMSPWSIIIWSSTSSMYRIGLSYSSSCLCQFQIFFRL